MSKTSTVAVVVNTVGDGSSTTDSVGPFAIASSPGQFTVANMAAGFNEIDCSAGLATFFLFNPAPANGGLAPIVKGATTDTGVAISSTTPSLIPTNAARDIAGPGGTVTSSLIYLTVAAAGIVPIGWF